MPLIDELKRIDRKGSNEGLAPDLMLAFFESNQDLSQKLERQLIKKVGRKDISFLAHGGFAITLLAGENQVVRLSSVEEYGRLVHPRVLQPNKAPILIENDKAPGGQINVEFFPRVTMLDKVLERLGVSQSDMLRISESLEVKFAKNPIFSGYRFVDFDVGNIGSMQKGIDEIKSLKEIDMSMLVITDGDVLKRAAAKERYDWKDEDIINHPSFERQRSYAKSIGLSHSDLVRELK